MTFNDSDYRRRGRRLIYIYDLLYQLVSRDLKLQYKRSVLGIAWSFVTPLMQLVVYFFVFRLIFSLNIPNYAAFAFAGMLVWNWFQTSLFRGASAITDNRELIRQPNFPISILPVVAVTTNLIHFLLSLPILIVFLANGGIWLNSVALLLPGLIALQFLWTLSLGYLVAALNVTFRDTQHILNVFLNLLIYVTPIFYNTDIIPEKYLSIYYLNPIVHLVEAYRAILIQGTLPNLLPLFTLGLVSLGSLLFTYRFFRQASYCFAEEL